jgi:hypothetical protein
MAGALSRVSDAPITHKMVDAGHMGRVDDDRRWSGAERIDLTYKIYFNIIFRTFRPEASARTVTFVRDLEKFEF